MIPYAVYIKCHGVQIVRGISYSKEIAEAHAAAIGGIALQITHEKFKILKKTKPILAA